MSAILGVVTLGVAVWGSLGARRDDPSGRTPLAGVPVVVGVQVALLMLSGGHRDPVAWAASALVLGLLITLAVGVARGKRTAHLTLALLGAVGLFVLPSWAWAGEAPPAAFWPWLLAAAASVEGALTAARASGSRPSA